MEAPADGGRVDFLAIRDYDMVSRSTHVENCLHCDMTEILVVATDKAAERKVRRQLERAGLIEQVELVVQDQN